MIKYSVDFNILILKNCIIDMAIGEYIEQVERIRVSVDMGEMLMVCK